MLKKIESKVCPTVKIGFFGRLIGKKAEHRYTITGYRKDKLGTWTLFMRCVQCEAISEILHVTTENLNALGIQPPSGG